MKPEYEDWIKKWLGSNGGPGKDGRGQCYEASCAMIQAFPELVLTKGYVHCIWGPRGHWWTKTETGEIVDPTSKQFPPPLQYQEYWKGMAVVIGRCMECGEHIWGDEGKTATFCDDRCERAFVRTLAPKIKSKILKIGVDQ